MIRSQLDALARNPNVKAFLHVIRAGESSQEDSAYQIVNGGDLFGAPPWEHPYKGLKTTQGGKAAGAYQFIPTTWGGLVRDFGFPDFSPPNQDAGAVGLISQHGALDDVLAGRIGSAIDKLATTWVSLPALRARAPAIFQQYGGTLAGSAPTTAPVAPTAPPKGHSMPIAALIAAFGPMLANLIPQVAKLLNPNPSEVASRNLAAAQTVFDTVVKATGQPNIQAAIESMQADPAVKDAVQQAVVTDPVIMGLLEVGGGIQAAREAGIKMQQSDRPFWFNPVFWVTLMFLPMVYWIVGSVLIGGYELPAEAPWWAHLFIAPFGTAFTAETRAGIINIVIGMVLGGMVGIWFGTSYGSMKKDDTIAQSKGPAQ